MKNLLHLLTPKRIEKFWFFTKKCEHEENCLYCCWVWVGSFDRKHNGYGQFSLGGKPRKAHRISYMIRNKIDLLDLHVCHFCDNRFCVNPNHLFLGTNHDNVKDKVKKNRQLKGESCSFSKLTEQTVLELRRQYHEDYISANQLSLEANIHAGTMGEILRGDIWRHVGGPIGLRKHTGRLRPEDKEKIILLNKEGKSQKEIAKLFGISACHVNNIIHGRA